MEILKTTDIALLRNKKVLITGASGFIGSNLTTALLHAGAIVYGSSRSERVSSTPNLHWLKFSLEDIEATRKNFQKIKPDIIYHLSGTVSGSTDISLVQKTFHSLVTSTVNMLTVATETGCERIVLIGSCREPLHQGQHASSPYAMAKWAASAYGNMFWECYKTPVTNVRTFVTYGPGQPSSMLIPHVISSLLKNESPKLSSGKWATDWIYIDDVVDGLLAAALAPGIEGATIDLGTGKLTSVREVVEKIDENISSPAKPLFGALTDRVTEHSYAADVSSAHEKLQWRAKTSLENGLAITINNIKASIFSGIWYFSEVLDPIIVADGIFM